MPLRGLRARTETGIPITERAPKTACCLVAGRSRAVLLMGGSHTGKSGRFSHPFLNRCAGVETGTRALLHSHKLTYSQLLQACCYFIVAYLDMNSKREYE